jgi:tetratricopeptide (TPR) repeat protein
LSDAFAAIGEDARRKEYLGILAQGGEAAVKRRADDDAARATQILSAEEAFRLGEMALRRQLLPQAVEQFKRALELNPDEGEHHALHAWTVWCITPDKERVATEVRRGMQRAIELNSKCAPAFFYLGQVYKHLGDRDRAYNHFRKALELQPGHVDAEREVRLHDMRKGKDTGRGKLFDRFKKK